MRTSALDASQRAAARVVGFTYLLAMATAVLGFSIREELIVAGNAAATAHNIIASEALFRIGIASDLMTFLADVVLITSLYVVLRPVNRNLALLAACWRLVAAAVLVVVTLNGFDVLRVLSGAEYLGAFEVDGLQALARLSLGAYGSGYDVGFVFLGLGSAVFSYLWFISRYVPRGLAALGVFASLLLAACSFAFIVSPGLSHAVGMTYMAPMGIFEIAMGFWLLFRPLAPGP